MNNIHKNNPIDQDKMKVIAFYLPQFYTFPENDRWWGKGFTEWTNTRKTRPLFKEHYQPHTPMSGNYYDLSDERILYEQIELAQKYGIYGFCFYHYWFDTKLQLMEKPVEAFLKNKDLNLPFCLSWANHSWTRTWVGNDDEMLMEQKYGDIEAIREHFEYLLPFFSDERYIKIDGKPILCIYVPQRMPDMQNRLENYNKLAKEHGFPGICFISQEPQCAYNPDDYPALDYTIMYEPNYSYSLYKSLNLAGKFQLACEEPLYIFNMAVQALKRRLSKLIKVPSLELSIYNYDIFWKMILRRKINNNKLLLCAFASWDNCPRRGYKGTVYHGSTPEKFETHFKFLLKKSKYELNKEIVFINAWNEWGEGAHLEPDERYGTKYLEAVKSALNNYKT